MQAFRPTKAQLNKLKKSLAAWAGLAVVVGAVAYLSQEAHVANPKKGNASKGKQVAQPKNNQEEQSTPSSSQKLRVTVSGLNMRSAPTSADENIIAQLKSDNILEVLSKEGNWWKVKSPDGQEGYVFDSENFIEIVK